MIEPGSRGRRIGGCAAKRAPISLIALLMVVLGSNPAKASLSDWLRNHIPFLGGDKPERFRTTLENPLAKLIAFFQPLGVMPIVAPTGEMPGDVYRSVLGGFRARQPTCFPNLPHIRGSSTLPAMSQASEG